MQFPSLSFPQSGPELLFVRHGEGEHNTANHQYRDGDPTNHNKICTVATHRHRLTDRGITQARQVGAILKTVGRIDKVISSDMVRALETAYIATDELDTKPPIEPWEMLQERSWGTCEWLPSVRGDGNSNERTLADRVHSDRQFFLPQGWQPPQGETSLSVIMRAQRALETLLNVGGSFDLSAINKRTVVFTHGEFMWFLDYVIRNRNIINVSTHEQVHEEVPHTCQIWHYKFNVSHPGSFMFRETLTDKPDTFSEWEHITPRLPTREEILAYIESNPRILFPKQE